MGRFCAAPGQALEIKAQDARDSILVSISDHGEGISKANLESIFNPFFTTKPKGVGLGLALVAKIVDEHGGHIEVTSDEGRGTRFEVMLPKS